MSGNLVGGMLGRYRIDRLIGRGGMATVYLALDPVFGRTVAIKVLTALLAHEAHYAERFQREARSMAQLQHPHILPVHDVGEQDGQVYLVMQYVEGGNLHEQLDAQRRAGELQIERTIAVLEAVGGALDYAHSRGVVHRDVKPQNILLTGQGYPYLTDFGIAKVINGEGSAAAISMANAIIGTPEYMSPEQAQGQPIDGRADLYALGVILYELFTGRTPFRNETREDTPLSILIRHAGATPPPPTSLNPALGPAVEAVLLRALAKRPSERFQTGAALFEALRAALAQPGQRATMVAPVLSPSRPTPLPALPNLTPPPASSSLATPVPQPSLIVAPPVPESSRSRSRPLFAALIGTTAITLALLGFLVARVAIGAGGVTATTVSAPPTATVPTGAVATGTVSPSPTPAVGPSPTVGSPAPRAAATPSTPAGGAATPSADTREVILFSSHRNDVHDSQIYIMNGDGSGQRQLTFTRGHSWGPRISPDGKYFVFSSVAPGEHIDHSATGGGRVGQGHHEVFRANVDGSDIVRLTNTNAWNNAWAWAPDSKSLIIASDRDGEWELYRMSVNGEQEQIMRLTNDPALDGWPSFTPDGKQIIFASDRTDKRSQIYVMDADGTNVRRLTNTTATATLPSVSPDGRRIVYAVQSGTEQTGITSDIFVMNIDGSNPTRLTRDSIAINSDPSWSPDGTRIVFSSDRDGNSNIYMMNADGTGTKRITTDPGEDVTPFWATIRVETSGIVVPVGEWASDESSVGSSSTLSAPVRTSYFVVRTFTGPLAHSPTVATLPSSPSARPSYRKRRRP